MRTGHFFLCCSIAFSNISPSFISPAGAAEPSFDCTKAATRAEKAICQDAQLGDLDTTLLAILRAALEKNPAARAQLLLEERQWVRERDHACVPSDASHEQSTNIAVCLREAYQKRIEVLRLAPAQAVAAVPEDPSKAVCHKIVDRYKALVEADPEAPYRKNPEYPISPLELLAQTKSSDVALEAKLPVEAAQTVMELAEKQTHITTFSKELSVAISEFVKQMESFDFSFSPEMGLFRISSVQGTADCNFNIFFSVKDGQAQLASEPDGWSEEGGACGFSEELGKVNGVPFAFTESNSSGQSSVSVLGWIEEKFKPLCSVNFEFLPRFLLHPIFRRGEESCERSDCEPLRQAALHLAEFVNSHQTYAQKRLAQKLPHSELRDFEILKEKSKAAHKESGEDTNPQMTDLAPLLLPFLFKNHLYLARVGHFTMGWRTFPDWSVVLEQSDKDTVAEVASFAIGMTSGKLLKADVK